MTDKQLRKLDRAGLLELLLDQSKELEALREELARTKEELARAQEQPEGVVLAPENAGSIAEAALQVTNVFAEAQKAADEYLKNIAKMHEQQAAEAAKRDEESRRQAEEIIAKAEEKCRAMEEDAKRRCEGLVRQAEQDAGRNWREMEEKIDLLKQSSEEMQTLLKTEKKRFRRG